MPSYKKKPSTPSGHSDGERANTPRRPKSNLPYKRRIFREIKKLQLTTNMLIPKASFTRIVKEVIQQYRYFNVTKQAVMAMQEATEAYICRYFERTQLAVHHAKRITLMDRDMVFYANIIEP